MARKKGNVRRLIEKQRGRSLEALLPLTTYEDSRGVLGEILEMRFARKTFKKNLGPLPKGVRSNRVRTARTLPSTPHRSRLHHTHVLLLPGNPGVIEFYRNLIQLVSEKLPLDVTENMTIKGLGLPGHDFRRLNASRAFGIPEHLAYVLSHLDSLQPPLEESNLILIGHSYGSYLALRVLADLPVVARRAHLIMLMPALWRLGQCAGPLTTGLLAFPGGRVISRSAGLLTALIAHAPSKLRSSILGGLGSDAQTTHILQKWIATGRHELYHNIVELLKTEVRLIKEPADHTVAMHLSPRCGARTRGGAPCRAPAVGGKRRCRMHGGARGSGAQPGNANALKHGFYSAAAKAERRALRARIRGWAKQAREVR